MRRGGNREGQALPGKWGPRLLGLIHQKDRNAIPNGIGLSAARALKRSAVIAKGEGMAAGGADQDLEQIVGNHGGNCTASVFLLLAVEW